MPFGKINILISESRSIIKSLITNEFNQDNDFIVVGSFISIKESIEQLQINYKPNIIILGNKDDFILIDKLYEIYPQAKIIAIIDSDHYQYLREKNIEIIERPAIIKNNDESDRLILLLKERSKYLCQQNNIENSQIIENYSFSKIAKSYNKINAIAIASSTGGPKALEKILTSFNNFTFDIPIFITQHLPDNFSKMLVKNLSNKTNYNIVEASNNEVVEDNKIYVARGGSHLVVRKQQNNITIFLDDGEPENHCKPSADPMIRSLSKIYGKNLLVIILTGLGNDGLAGCFLAHEDGAIIIAQDKESSVVWGMPGSVVENNLATVILNVNDIAKYVMSIMKKGCNGN
jgi:chemotaxis response regulator CheB